MHNHHYQLFKVAILSVFLGFAVELKAQQIIIQKGDTLYSGPSDSIYVVSFKLKGINMDSIQKVNIKFFSGTAQQGIDFSLRDGNKPTKEIIGISITDGKGQFSIKVVNDIQEIKTINLQATITDGSRVQPDIARIIIMPLKKAKPEGSDPSKKLTGDSTVDSLYFKRYRQDGIPVYIDTDKKVKFPKRGHLKWLRKSIPKAINIRDVEIDRVAQDLFYIKTISTESEVFADTLKLVANQFDKVDKLFLSDTARQCFIHARDIFEIRIQKKDAKVAGVTSSSTIKFPLQK